jgi:Leucine-rich repeat (LRR) protein
MDFMSSSSISPLNLPSSASNRRTVSGRGDADEGDRRTKKMRLLIPENLILKKMPTELVEKVLQMAGDLGASRVNRAFRDINRVECNDSWSELVKAPGVAPYLNEMAPNLTDFQKTRALFEKMTGELAILDPEALAELNPRDRILDPTLYVAIVQKIREINDLSLERAWPKMRARLGRDLEQNERENLPPNGTSANELRIWLNLPDNQPLILNITSLDLKGVNLLVVPPEIKNFTELRRLNVSANKIKGINPFAFADLTHLKKIDFTSNDLRKIPETLFSTCNRLKDADFRKNKLTHLPQFLFAGCPDLEIVNFRDNQLVAIPEELFSGSPKISNVCFTANTLTRLPPALFVGCRELESVEFNDNFLTEIPSKLFKNCRLLLEVFFRENQLFEIEGDLFEFNGWLAAADFGDNLLETIPKSLFSKCHRLRGAYLDQNEISSIGCDWFLECLGLQRLDFRGNKIHFVSDDLCRNCESLKIAHFQGNQVASAIKNGSQGHPKLRTAYLGAEAELVRDEAER